MKITSINYIDVALIPRGKTRTTERSKAVQDLVKRLSDAPEGKGLIISGTDIARFESYALQKMLRTAGQRVTVTRGKHPQTGAESIFIRKLTADEWKQVMEAHASSAPAKSATATKGKK